MNHTKLIEAVGKLVKAKGRFHTEQNYKAVVEAYDEAIAERATEAGTPAKGGIASPDFNALLQAVIFSGATDNDEKHADAWSGLEMHINQWGAALAEEARREGYTAGLEQGTKDGLQMQMLRPDFDFAKFDLCAKVAAQRTAGGDAEKPPHTAEEVIAFVGSHYEVMESQTTDPADVRFQLTVHDLQSAFRWWFGEDDEPVAEAAAQADDVASLCADKRCMLHAEPGSKWCCNCDPAAAPTAQPTPQAAAQNEANSLQTRMNAHSKALLVVQSTQGMWEKDGLTHVGMRPPGDGWRNVLAAQPTLPDDELVTQLREYAGNPGYSHGDYADTMRQAADRLAALRQPGALPDEAVTELLAALDAQEALRKEIRDAGMPPHSDYWHQPIDEARERVEKARAALAAKQAGNPNT